MNIQMDILEVILDYKQGEIGCLQGFFVVSVFIFSVLLVYESRNKNSKL